MSIKNSEFARRQNIFLREVIGARIYDLVKETPLSPAPQLSAATNCRVFLKREDLQPIFSFKVRGAYHKMTRLSAAKLARGVVAASAGNHAQGVALAAQKLNCRAIIVMPKHAQRIKVLAVRAFGAKVLLQGENFDEAYTAARELARAENATFIPPFDDADIIVGNGTIAAEMLRQHPAKLAAVFVAVGGGGLLAGVAGYIKMLRPDIKVIGVEAAESACMHASLKVGRRVVLPQVGAFADAVAVKTPGQLPFEFARRLVDDMVVVNNDELCAAVKDMYEDTRVIFEPGGALAVAGLKRYAAGKKWQNKNLAAIASGANMNFDRLRFIAERAEIGEHREALFAVTIPERAGSFRRFCALLGARNITEFNYRLGNADAAHIFAGVQIQDDSERKMLLEKLRAADLPALDLTSDEMSKLHLRHCVGGRARAANEVLYRFEFPERPGALIKFLDMLGQSGLDWNISLFHYRNHGSDIGRVLAGIQVPPSERVQFTAFLKKLGYPYCRESDNPAYRLFLQGG